MRYLARFDDPGRLSEAYQSIYERDTEGLGGGSRGGWSHVLGAVVSRLGRLFDRSETLHYWAWQDGKDRRILDVGCSDGSRLRRYLQGGWAISGVDVNEEAIRRARALGGDFRSGTLEQAGYESETFHLVRLDNVLEHVEDPRALLKTVHELLHSDGELAIFVPSGRSWSLRVFGGNSISAWVPFHLNLFDRRTIACLLRDCGFVDVKVKQNTPLAWLGLTVKQLASRGRPFRVQLSPWEEAASLALGPVAWVANLSGRGEELAVFCRRP